tara:strand:- start:1181 stop:2068 length:888 start_codon:yes stop_codon:yes gene_type:complete
MSDEATVIRLLQEAIFQACHGGIIHIFDEMIQTAIAKKRESLIHQKMRLKDGHTTGALVLFQQEIQKKCKREGEGRLDDTIDRLKALLSTECPFKEMLKKVIVMQVHLVSKSRKSEGDSITIDEPSMDSFCESVLTKCGCIFFHNVETYYQCYQKKNYKQIQEMITEVVTKSLSKYTCKAYSIFFSDKHISNSDILDDAINTSISKANIVDFDDVKEIKMKDGGSDSKSSDYGSDINQKDLDFLIQNKDDIVSNSSDKIDDRDGRDDRDEILSQFSTKYLKREFREEPDELMSQF